MGSYSKKYYMQKALEYAERYGIITYRVDGNTIVYNQNYNEEEYNGGKWVRHPHTYQTKVNLDTMETSRTRLKKLQKNGWDNV